MLNQYKRYLIFPIDMGFMILSFFLAHWIRYESFEFIANPMKFTLSMLVVVGSRSIVFIFSNIYRSIWAYASIHDLLEIIKTTIISSLVSTVTLLFYNRFHHQSRMVQVLDGLLLLSFLCFRSFSWRLMRDYYLEERNAGLPTLLIGAGKLGAMLLTELRRQTDLGLKPIGFLDDDNNKVGAHIHGLPVLGLVNELERIIQENEVKEVIITSNKLVGKQISWIKSVCERFHIIIKIVPSFSDIFSGKLSVSQIREIRVEDLLGRDAVDLEIASIRSYLQGKTILITGAAGSIGSEISRQVSRFGPSRVILLDSAETPLYHIDYELRTTNPEHIEYVSLIADVKNVSRLSSIFETWKPSVVFHCAAYKHVPLMEINPEEAVLNNVQGTKNVADISQLSGVDKFVLISTDKAVNPVNIMGASKRAAELYIQYIAPASRTRFVTVRFGNVLGSNGSVIPRFKEQIENGGPITVTHPDIIRYFMTIPEASQLVIQAGAMGERGEIFLLDMGEPVKILELAEEMIRLSGLQPYKDIDIVFTGLRPGEKLYEELLLGMEGIKKTHHPKIMIAAHSESINRMRFLEDLNELFQVARAGKREEIFQLFKKIVTEYKRHDEYITSQKVKNE
ncbi:MAG: polysaccharide biosynthesis protein [Leptospiraceae bacterium]|nr:polysaccharide biosynthesis protein [Leptospiraceae bacterium]MCP5502405.1 polysaccharide biosynthesis protein [Leptospiraceae bacterium]